MAEEEGIGRSGFGWSGAEVPLTLVPESAWSLRYHKLNQKEGLAWLCPTRCVGASPQAHSPNLRWLPCHTVSPHLLTQTPEDNHEAFTRETRPIAVKGELATTSSVTSHTQW